MKTINLENVMELLEAAVEKKGREYVDPDSLNPIGPPCQYVKGGAPSCIVGHVLVEFGVPVAALESADGGVAEIFDPMFSDAEELRELVELTLPAQRVLTAAQDAQDRGGSWGVSLDEARRVHGKQVYRVKNVAGVTDTTAEEDEGASL